MGGAPPPYPPQMPFVLGQPPSMQGMAPYGVPPNFAPPGMGAMMYQSNMYQPASIYQPPPGGIGGQFGGAPQPQYVGAPGQYPPPPQQPWQNPSQNPGGGGYGGYQGSMGGMAPQQGGLGMGGGPGMGGPGGPPYPPHSNPGFGGYDDGSQPPFDNSGPPAMPYFPYRGQ